MRRITFIKMLSYFIFLGFFTNNLFSQSYTGTNWNYGKLERIKLLDKNYSIKKDTISKILVVGNNGNYIQLEFREDTIIDKIISECFLNTEVDNDLKYIPNKIEVEKKNLVYKKLSKTLKGSLVFYKPIKTKNNTYFCVFKATVLSARKKGKGFRRSKKLLVRVIDLQLEKDNLITYHDIYNKNTVLQLVPFPYEGKYVLVSVSEFKKDFYLTTTIRYLADK